MKESANLQRILMRASEVAGAIRGTYESLLSFVCQYGMIKVVRGGV